MTRAKKQFGQHFLQSNSALLKIRDAADIVGNDIVLEIGPGLGALTAVLLHFAGKVVAIEKDRDLIPHLEEKFKTALANNQLEILQEDILDFDPNVMGFYKDLSYKLVANIPYYITGAILEKFLTADTQPERMVLLVQKEVAERIVTRDKKESVLSLSVKAYGAPKLIAKVPAGAFSPPPKVDSAILLIDDISREFFKDCTEKLFFQVIKAAFNGKRKQLRNTIGEFLSSTEQAKTVLEQAGIPPTARPETIQLLHWKKLTQAIEKTMENSATLGV